MIGIYKITNLVNGLVYIGQSKDVDNRLKSHASCSTNTHLRNSILRYGKDNFSFECIEECEISALNERERYYITLYKSNQPEYGYNFTSGGEREPGWYHSDETKHKLSLQAKQRASNPDYCNPAQHSRLIHKGAVTSRASGTKLTTMLNDGWELGPSKEFVQAGSAKRRGENNGVFGKGYLFSGELNHFYGKHHTEESKQKIREHMPDTSFNWRGHHHSEESKQKMRGPRPSLSGERNPNYGKRGEKSVMYGRRAIHKGDVEKRVKAEDLESYLVEGWKLGVRPNRLDTYRKCGKQHMEKLLASGFDTKKFASTKGKKLVHKDGQAIYVSLDRLDSYIKDGWETGGNK